jgi:hypothetical protein
MGLKRFFLGSLLGTLAVSCNSLGDYVVDNSGSELSRTDLAVVISRADVKKYQAVPEGDQFVVAIDGKGEVLPSQNDDLDGDGQWDELAFLVDVDGESQKSIHFEVRSAAEMPVFPKRTNIRFGYQHEPFAEVVSAERLKTTDSPSSSAAWQMEGPAWENDVVGFRNYYDARNGMDIYGKRTSEMVLDSVGIRGQYYHELDDWGMDILHTGASLGAGAIAIRVGDTLTRVGVMQQGTYRFITEGPVRAIFELAFEGVEVGDRRYNLRHEISIYAGDHFYRSNVWVDGLNGDEELVAGIVNLHQKESFQVDVPGFKIVASHGPQAFLGENLGMAILVPEDEFVGSWKAPDTGYGIVETHLVSMKLTKGKSTDFAFFAGWEYQDDGFARLDYFKKMVSGSTLRLKP